MAAAHERTVRHAILAHHDARHDPAPRRIGYRGERVWLGEQELDRFTSLGAVIDEAAGEILLAPMLSGTPAYADQEAGTVAPIAAVDVLPGAEPFGVVPVVVAEPALAAPEVDADNDEPAPRPAKVALKDDWESYAVTCGLSPSEASEMTKAELIEMFAD